MMTNINFPDFPKRLFMTDEERTPDVLPLIETLSPGTGVIFRHYNFPNRESLGGQLAALCQRKKCPLIVAGDFKLAKKLKAFGVHLPANNLDISCFPFGTSFVSAAVHNEEELKKAEALGVSALLIGPVFPTKSHPNGHHLGLGAFVALAEQTNLPVYALGGLSEKRIKKLPTIPNLVGIAGISLFKK